MPEIIPMRMIFSKLRERIGTVEIVARKCGKFAGLYEMVDGANSRETAIAIAT